MIGHVNAVYAWEAFCLVVGPTGIAYWLGKRRKNKKAERRRQA